MFRLKYFIVFSWVMLFFLAWPCLAQQASNKHSELKELENTILQGHFGKISAQEAIEEFLPAEGMRLEEAYLGLTLRKQETLPVLRERLRSGTILEKRKITKLIRYSRWSEAIPDLIAIAKSKKEHEIARIGALYAIGSCDDNSVCREILPLLHELERGDTERRIIIATLAKLGCKDVVPDIRFYITDKNMLVRIFALRALAELGETVNPDFLIEAAQNEDYVIRQEACGALGAIGGTEAINMLEWITTEDSHAVVRQEARVSLTRIDIQGLSENEKVLRLKSLIKDSDKKLRRWAIEMLATECGNIGKTALEEHLSKDTVESKRIMVRLLMLSNDSGDTEGGVK